MKLLKKLALILLMLISLIALTGCNNKETKKQENNIPETQQLGESANLYIGSNSKYSEFKISFDYNTSKEEQASKIIGEIGTIIGYRIKTNEIKINDNKIYIDFTNESAPFYDYSYIGTDVEEFDFRDYDSQVYTIFDSIKETLEKHFNKKLEVYYTKNGQEIYIENTVPELKLPINEEYKGRENYQK